ncbi:MAG: hypothetical protein LBU32_04655 [Clostridiales bacterium]|nr:hypothetical protein [Clostridiales bacterium]
MITVEASEISVETAEITVDAAEIPFEAPEIPTVAATPAAEIPALAAAAAPVRPSAWQRKGIQERIDPECKRHGTSGTAASRNAAAGEILLPPFQPKRTEVDFARRKKGAAAVNPGDKYIIISGNLNAHKSETLAEPVADDEKIDADFSESGKNAES